MNGSCVQLLRFAKTSLISSIIRFSVVAVFPNPKFRRLRNVNLRLSTSSSPEENAVADPAAACHNGPPVKVSPKQHARSLRGRGQVANNPRWRRGKHGPPAWTTRAQTWKPADRAWKPRKHDETTTSCARGRTATTTSCVKRLTRGRSKRNVRGVGTSPENARSDAPTGSRTPGRVAPRGPRRHRDNEHAVATAG